MIINLDYHLVDDDLCSTVIFLELTPVWVVSWRFINGSEVPSTVGSGVIEPACSKIFEEESGWMKFTRGQYATC